LGKGSGKQDYKVLAAVFSLVKTGHYLRVHSKRGSGWCYYGNITCYTRGARILAYDLTSSHEIVRCWFTAKWETIKPKNSVALGKKYTSDWR